MEIVRFLQELVQQFFTFFSFPALGINGLDIIIILVFGFYAFEGYSLGLIAAALDLISFIVAFLIALKTYGAFAALLAAHTHISRGFLHAIGFFVIAFVCEVGINILFRRLAKRIHLYDYFIQQPHDRSLIKQLNHPLGIIPGFLSAFIILAFLFSVMLSFPTSPYFKNLITQSRFGGYLVDNSQQFEKTLNGVFGGAITETLNFLTVEPKSNERISLGFTVTSVTIDQQAEEQMFTMVNHERTSRGLKPLVLSEDLRSLARRHSKDMFARGYFSHYNPEGQSPFDRMAEAGITYTAAGENLALAPSTELAMQGLMQSPGHRANILSKDFGHIGIGVIDAGIYGKMFTQEFTD